jgi:hypothetical protein
MSSGSGNTRNRKTAPLDLINGLSQNEFFEGGSSAKIPESRSTSIAGSPLRMVTNWHV